MAYAPPPILEAAPKPGLATPTMAAMARRGGTPDESAFGKVTQACRLLMDAANEEPGLKTVVGPMVMELTDTVKSLMTGAAGAEGLSEQASPVPPGGMTPPAGPPSGSSGPFRTPAA